MKKQTKSKTQDLKRGYLSLLLRLAVTAAVLLLFFSFVCLLWRVQGQDMYPALRDGDLLLAYRLDKSRNRGDVVIYQAEGQRRAGRIVAREGDQVGITEDGKLTVNGVLQSETVFYETKTEQENFSLQVPEGCIYILGDHRDACRDSRDFGPVSVQAVEGRLIGLLRIRGF